jgi:LysR family glycine cleavage system transcriptional activator
LKTPDDLLKEHIIQVIGNRRGWNEWLRMAGLPEVEQFKEVQTDTSGIAISLAMSGAGVALGHRSLVDGLLANGTLVRPFDTEMDSPGVFHLITPSERDPCTAAQKFKAWLLAECGL